MMDAAGQDAEKASMKLAQWRATERDFCKQTGMPRDRFRSQVEGFGRSEASDAVWKFRKAKSSGMVFVEDIFSDEKYLQTLEKERVIAYDKNGKIILAKYGDVSSIQFSSKEISRVKGSILTHNHPSNGPLSDTDIYRL